MVTIDNASTILGHVIKDVKIIRQRSSASRDENEFYDKNRLSRSILKNEPLSTRELPMAISKEAKDFTENKLLDDKAILAACPIRRSK